MGCQLLQSAPRQHRQQRRALLICHGAAIFPPSQDQALPQALQSYNQAIGGRRIAPLFIKSNGAVQRVVFGGVAH